MTDIIGTEAGDSLVGTAGNDHLQGLGGIDSLDGAGGDDLVEGGDGDDYLYSSSGSDTLDGGSGDDHISVSNADSAAATVTLSGGEGDDDIQIDSFGPHAFEVDGGAGADTVRMVALANGGTAEVTLGGGVDTLSFTGFYGATNSLATASLTVTDFAAGADGDRIDWLDLLGKVLTGWDGESNPFASGYARLVQSGADVLVQIDRDAAGSDSAFTTLVTLAGVNAADLTWQNLDGFSADGTIPSDIVLTGTEGRDRLVGSAGGDRIDGLGDSDTIWGGVGADVIDGGDGMDSLYGEGGADHVDGGAGDDFIDGGKGADQLLGGDGDDFLYDLDGNDTLDGGPGNDRISLVRGSLHSDLVTGVGGNGDDQFFIQSVGTSHLVADGGDGNDVFDITALSSLATLTLGAGTDRIILRGDYAGYLMTAGTIDVTDFAAGAGGDVVDLGGFFPNGDGGNPFGNGLLQLVQEGPDAVLQTGGPGLWHTIVRFEGRSAAAFVAENFGGFAPDGSPPPGSTFIGSDAPDEYFGGAGADTIDGLGGHDHLVGGAGNDTISGGGDYDEIDGGSGNDQIDAGDGDDAVHDGDGNDQVLLGPGDDFILSSSGSDIIDGGPGGDTIWIDRQNGHPFDVVSVTAGDGDDVVEIFDYAGATVSADLGAGDDRAVLHGVIGTVTLTLGAGADVVDFSGAQYGWLKDENGAIVVTDFSKAEGDRLDLSALISTGLSGWDGSANPFSAGYLRLVQSGADARLELDDDAAGDHPFILLAEFKNFGANSFATSDFGFAVPVVYGSAGNDVFVVDEAGDQVSDPGGTDEVRTSLATYVLPAGLENLTGTSAGAQDLRGNGLNNILAGGGGNDFFRLQDGGNDTASGGAGADAFYFGAAYNSADSVDGGPGADVVALQGDYAGGVTLGMLTNVETLAVLPHDDNRFGGGGPSPFSYSIVAPDAAVAAGTQLLVNASTLGAGENLTFDGHAETNGSFFIYGGKGMDTLTGGAGADVFFFAEDGRFAATDHVDGGAGQDIMVLRGNYSLTLSGTSMVNVETVVLMSGSDARFYATTTKFSYDIATAEDTVAAGQTMTFNGGRLALGETLHFDGSAEHDGAFRLF
ncbi:MAG: hypothetical protein QOK17_1871, partial [Sphingomonadales bacterium]|nr:hypothetical protein [Sphingomonadales bacterium]